MAAGGQALMTADDWLQSAMREASLAHLRFRADKKTPSLSFSLAAMDGREEDGSTVTHEEEENDQDVQVIRSFVPRVQLEYGCYIS